MSGHCDYLLVTSASERTGRNGKPFMDLQVRLPQQSVDRLGLTGNDYPAKIWDSGLQGRSRPEVGQVILANHAIQEYNGTKQLIITSYEIETDRDKYLPLFREAAAVDQETVYRRLFVDYPWVDPDLAALMANVVAWLEEDGGARKQRLLDVPGGERMHHVRRAGLLQHLEEMWDAALSLNLGRFAGIIDVEVVLAGTLLHDIGKIDQYDVETLHFRETTELALVGHTCFAAALINDRWPPDGDGELRLRLVHAVLAHHGALSNGAPVVPRTPEATLLAALDGLSARLDAHYAAHEARIGGRPVGYSAMLACTPVPVATTRGSDDKSPADPP